MVTALFQLLLIASMAWLAYLLVQSQKQVKKLLFIGQDLAKVNDDAIDETRRLSAFIAECKNDINTCLAEMARVCECEGLRTVVLLSSGSMLQERGYPALIPHCRSCGGLVPDEKIDREKTGEVDVIAEYMLNERKHLADLLRSFMDYAPPLEGESPLLAGLVVLKGKLAEERTKVEDRNILIEELRTRLWGSQCFFCKSEPAVTRVPTGEPIGPVCIEGKVWEKSQAAVALAAAVMDV